jgi:hypothetical protein
LRGYDEDFADRNRIAGVSQAGDEYLALLLVPGGDLDRIMVGRGISEIEAHEQLINVLIDLVEPLADKSFALQSPSTS